MVVKYKRLWGFLLLFFYINSTVFSHVITPEFSAGFLFRYFIRNGIQYIFSYGFYHILCILGIVCVIQSRTTNIQQIVLFFIAYLFSLFWGASSSVVIPPYYSSIILFLSLVFLGVGNGIGMRYTKYRWLFILFLGYMYGTDAASSMKSLYAPLLFHSTNNTVSILAFAIGIIVALLSVVGLVYMIVFPFRKYKALVFRYVNFTIAVLGVLLLLQSTIRGLL